MEGKSNRQKVSAAFLFLLVLNGCGKDEKGLSPVQQEQRSIGTFRTRLESINPSISKANGTSQIRVERDIFHARVYVRGAEYTTHMQHIHSGKRCPTKEDDTNRDGVIDAAEAEAVYGPPIFSIDDRLSSIEGTFPDAGDYNFDQSATLSQVLEAHRLPSLDVQGMIVDVHGVSQETALPGTVNGDTNSLPIACGRLD